MKFPPAKNPVLHIRNKINHSQESHFWLMAEVDIMNFYLKFHLTQPYNLHWQLSLTLSTIICFTFVNFIQIFSPILCVHPFAHFTHPLLHFSFLSILSAENEVWPDVFWTRDINKGDTKTAAAHVHCRYNGPLVCFGVVHFDAV